jgi:hypothetical protein
LRTQQFALSHIWLNYTSVGAKKEARASIVSCWFINSNALSHSPPLMSSAFALINYSISCMADLLLTLRFPQKFGQIAAKIAAAAIQGEIIL